MHTSLVHSRLDGELGADANVTLGQARETRWRAIATAVVALATTAALVALGASLTRSEMRDPTVVWANRLSVRLLGQTVVAMMAAVLLAGSIATAWMARHQSPASVERLSWLAARLLPLGPLALAPYFWSWWLWQGHDLGFLLLVLALATGFGASVTAATRAGPSGVERRALEALRARLRRSGAALRAARIEPGTLVVTACALGYVVWFSYHTAVWHLSVRSGYDLAIEDNILWNLLHGGPFFKAAPTLGPTGSHFGRHSTLISYLLVPFYALHQSAETLLVLQSVLLGAAALPLYWFGRRRVGAGAAAVIAIAYLMHPALQQSNLFEVHYVKLGLPFFFATIWLLDAGRTRWALVAAALTLATREDVATWIVLLGVWAALSGRAVRAGLIMTFAGGLYVVLVKFVVMPSLLHGGDDLLFMYRGLMPQGGRNFGSVMTTVVGNPAFTLESLLEPGKLIFVLQVLVPVALLPVRRFSGWWALIPGALYCVLGTQYPPLIDIHYQYSAHFLAFLFPVLVLGLPGASGGHRRGALAALIVATLLCSYQYGAVLQQNTSRGGPFAYKFGWDAEGLERRRALKALIALVPRDAKVAASALTVPQFSSRANGYSLSIDLYDAEWIVAPTVLAEYVPSEIARTREALSSGQWGLVARDGPFFIARKGHTTERNGEILPLLAP
jgi:uncharacterized membrane protein